MVWSPTQMAQVEGHLRHVNAVVADEGLFKAALDPEHACSGTVDPVAGDPATRYDSETNPAGVRCSVLDLLVNQLGPRPRVGVEPIRSGPPATASPACPSPTPACSTACRRSEAGLITPAQFVDLNAKVGGLDVDSDPTAARIAGDPAAIASAYRTGLINEANHLDEVAIINHGGPDPGHRPRLRPRVLDRGAAPGRPGQHRQPGDVVRPDAADRRPDLGERGADRDGRLARRGRGRRLVTSRSPRRSSTDRPADVTDRCVVGRARGRLRASSSCRHCRPGSPRRARRPAARRPTTTSPAG